MARLARKLNIESAGERILLDGEDVGEAVRATEVTAVTRYAADNPQVRAHLVELQRRAAGKDDIVVEGRDQGTVAFPDAQCKIFLTAGAEERARRRLRDLQAQGEPVVRGGFAASRARPGRRRAGGRPLRQAPPVGVRNRRMTSIKWSIGWNKLFGKRFIVDRS